ncbi:MAG TPA: transketolase C-terminal domain-containing protein [Galbitalea sp.]|jgi:pyruvate dehydrogenase E1 component beta subunit|nr:transketolase C-terminal domain-containing protein [Galbitalea sp.]
MKRLTITKAMNEALAEEMRLDERVFLMGIDVEIGVMGRTKGLADEFGPGRVRDTPVSELAFLGAGVGAAAAGMVPVVDLMFSNFLYVCFDQLANQAGKLRYMMGGSASFPLTVMAGTGAAGSMAAQHSDFPIAPVINSGGVKVVCPSTPEDAKGLLKASIRDPNPVLYLVHTAMGGVRGEVPDGDCVVPLAKARVLREGDDVTVVAWSLMARRALEAAQQLEGEISVEVVDPRTLHPIDRGAIVSSVEKTGRLVVVDEARQTCSAGGDVIAGVAREALGSLLEAPRLVANPDVHVPYAVELESQVIPQVDDIVQAVRGVAAQAVA